MLIICYILHNYTTLLKAMTCRSGPDDARRVDRKSDGAKHAWSVFVSISKKREIQSSECCSGYP